MNSTNTIGPWKVMSNKLTSISKFDELLKNLTGTDIEKIWQFLHMYYVINRTFKAYFYLNIDESISKNAELYFFLGDIDDFLIRPEFIPRTALSEFPKTLVNVPKDLCKQVVLAVEYNKHIITLGELQEHFCNLNCSSCDKSAKEVINKKYELIGLYKLSEWKLSNQFSQFLRTMFEVLDEDNVHNTLENLYNKSLGLLIEDKLKKTENISEKIYIYSNKSAYFPNEYANDAEFDIVLENKKNKRILIMEITSHSNQNTQEWKEHFKKKSAISNILFQHCYSQGWHFKYLYFYSHKFAKAPGILNFSSNGYNLNSHFVPIPMWDFKQFEYLRNFNRNFRKVFSKNNSIHNIIKNTLTQKLNTVVNISKDFLIN